MAVRRRQLNKQLLNTLFWEVPAQAPMKDAVAPAYCEERDVFLDPTGHLDLRVPLIMVKQPMIDPICIDGGERVDGQVLEAQPIANISKPLGQDHDQPGPPNNPITTNLAESVPTRVLTGEVMVTPNKRDLYVGAFCAIVGGIMMVTSVLMAVGVLVPGIGTAATLAAGAVGMAGGLLALYGVERLKKYERECTQQRLGGVLSRMSFMRPAQPAISPATAGLPIFRI